MIKVTLVLLLAPFSVQKRKQSLLSSTAGKIPELSSWPEGGAAQAVELFPNP